MKPRWPFTAQESSALGWLGAAGKGRFLFCLNWFLCPEWQRGNNNVRYQIVVTGLSHLTCMPRLGDLKRVWFANDANSASLLFVSRVSPDFAFSSENGYFATHGCCLFPPAPPCDIATWPTELNRRNTSMQCACKFAPRAQCSAKDNLLERPSLCSAAKVKEKAPGMGRTRLTTSNLSCQLHHTVLYWLIWGSAVIPTWKDQHSLTNNLVSPYFGDMPQPADLKGYSHCSETPNSSLQRQRTEAVWKSKRALAGGPAFSKCLLSIAAFSIFLPVFRSLVTVASAPCNKGQDQLKFVY